LPVGQTECPSDITLWINDVEIGTWTCPGFFTGTRGRYTPAWLNISSNQYGLLKTWYINQEGSRIDGMKLSDVTPRKLRLFKHKFIRVRIGHKPDAANKNGITLFGRHFGNYPQDLILQVKYCIGKERKLGHGS
jgi:predicted transcriptional regulator